MPTTAAHIIVKGLVQGVGYRYFASGKARDLDITGYVHNLPNGDVEVIAEGDKAMVESLIKELRIGPRASHVTDLLVNWKTPTNSFKNFEYR